jgi:hypothetical protein
MALSSHSNKQQFVHLPLQLETASIRLVMILPLNADGIIRCTVRHTTLGASIWNSHPAVESIALDYTCLSYVWGSPEETRCIILNGLPFQVRKNLWDLLYVLSLWAAQGLASTTINGLPGLDIERCTQRLWIDALCIDQNNIMEKNHQVQQMGWIYSNATQVVSWLGDKPDLARLFRYANNSERGDKQPLLRSEALRIICKLCDDIYWKRAWITQEILLARDLYLLSQAVLVSLPALQRADERLLTGEAYRNYKPLSKLVHDARKQSSSFTLMQNLWEYRGKQCADPRDLAFSLISLSSDGARLQVDYDCSLAEIARSILRLHEAQRLCLCKSDALFQLLCLDETRLSSQDLKMSLFLIETDDLMSGIGTCHTCSMQVALDWSKLPLYNVTKAKLLCMGCWRSDSAPLRFEEHWYRGHLLVVWGTSAYQLPNDWHVIYIQPLTWSESHYRIGRVQPRYEPGGDRYRMFRFDDDSSCLIVSLGLMLQLKSLMQMARYGCRHERWDVSNEALQITKDGAHSRRFVTWKVAT